MRPGRPADILCTGAVVNQRESGQRHKYFSKQAKAEGAGDTPVTSDEAILAVSQPRRLLPRLGLAPSRSDRPACDGALPLLALIDRQPRTDGPEAGRRPDRLAARAAMMDSSDSDLDPTSCGVPCNERVRGRSPGLPQSAQSVPRSYSGGCRCVQRARQFRPRPAPDILAALAASWPSPA